MTIIEALKKLGKSLLGDNYTPTEAKTDSQIAETIEGISKAIDDAGGIGGGSGGGRIIDFTKLEHREEVDPEDDEDIINYFSGYEAGLSEEDFINSWLTGIGRRGELVPIAPIRIDDGFVILYAGDKPYDYNPETGEFSYTTPGGNPK